jgi:hypothetical protein
MTTITCFALLVVTGLAGVALGGGAAAALDLVLADTATWVLLGAGAVVGAAVAAAALHRQVFAPQIVAAKAASVGQEIAAARAETQRRLRHDVRGALSPALLTADRLLSHADPAVQRAGDIMVRAVEKTAALLADPGPPPTSPPGRS